MRDVYKVYHNNNKIYCHSTTIQIENVTYRQEVCIVYVWCGCVCVFYAYKADICKCDSGDGGGVITKENDRIIYLASLYYLSYSINFIASSHYYVYIIQPLSFNI